MATVVITGGSGLIGSALTKLLVANEHQVVILTRNPHADKARKNKPSRDKEENLAAIRYAHWNVEEQKIDPDALEQADYIIHLAGAGVADKRWTTRRKKEIKESRTQSSALLLKGLKENPNKVKAILSASGIGWYGADLARLAKRSFVETDPPSIDFLGETCKLWEESIEPATLMGIRLVKFRTGIVLSRNGGAFPEFKKPVRFGIAGILGSGKQMVSWIHIDDICRMYLFAIENHSVSGVYNAVAPKPVSNKELTLQLARTYKSNFFVPLHVPNFALAIMLGEMREEVLKSATVCCDKIRKAGFNFTFPTIENAINDLLK